MNRAASPVPPDLVARISDLELIARVIADGLVSGLHRSPFHGYSAEFSQYRHYRPGDDLKYVDWKLVARTDRVYTKQFRETTNLAAAFVVDTSASMAFPEAGLTKFRYAVVAAAALAHVVSSQGDAVGFVTRDRFVAPRSGRQHLRGVLAGLSGLECGGDWDGPTTIRRAAERLGRRGLLFVLSDFYDREDEIAAELRRASRLGHEIVLFQTVTPDEVQFAYGRDLEFVDLESGATITVDALAARRDYTDAFAAFLERSRRRARAEGFSYTLMLTDQPHHRVLRNFLLQRSIRGRTP
jgi:uncharacterized protein (DUF58 family)